MGQHSTDEAYAIDEFVNSVKKHQSAHTQSEEQQTKVVVAEKVVLNFHFCLYLIKWGAKVINFMVKTTFCSHFFVLLQSAYLKTAEIDQSDDENIFHIICLFSLFSLPSTLSGE